MNVGPDLLVLISMNMRNSTEDQALSAKNLFVLLGSPAWAKLKARRHQRDMSNFSPAQIIQTHNLSTPAVDLQLGNLERQGYDNADRKHMENNQTQNSEIRSP
eukprot:1144390-Pelagomonas_calceolata.AAC.2